MIKLASIALIVAAGTAQACPSVGVTYGAPSVTLVPRIAYAPVFYAGYGVGYDHEGWRERHWYRERAWERYRHRDEHGWREREWDRR